MLQGVLQPFIDNAALLKAMFARCRPSAKQNVATAPSAPSGAVKSSLPRDDDNGGIGTNEANSDQPVGAVASTMHETEENASKTQQGQCGNMRWTSSTDGDREEQARGGGEWSAPAVDTVTGRSSEGMGPSSAWGYRSYMCSRGCWRVDAGTAARADASVELDFDSVAFEVFVDLEHQRLER